VVNHVSARQTDKDRTIADLKTLIASVESEWDRDPSVSLTEDSSSSQDSSSCRRQDLQPEAESNDSSSCRRQDLPVEDAEADLSPRQDRDLAVEAKQDLITDPEQARNIALHRLSARPRSRAELKKDLVHRHVEESLADQIVARFIEVGLVDDKSFAREWVASRRGPKSLSTARLKRELAGKGISPAIIDEALSEMDGSESEIALQLARKRAKSLIGKDRPTMTRRLAAQLERRGFSPAVVRRAVIRAVDEAMDATGDDSH